MKDSDKQDFVTMLSATLDLYGRKLSPGAYSIWFETMKQWDLVEVRAALSKWVQQGKSSAPVPFDIVKILQANDGWIEVEEAWAIVSKTLNDERVTVFWTPPMQKAFGVALELQDDQVAARMAFKEVYSRELAAARDRGERPNWQMSPGTDPDMRRAAVVEAARLGRISQESADRLAPPKGPSSMVEHIVGKMLSPGEEAA